MQKTQSESSCLQTDFGLKDQAVAAMRGVIRSVDRRVLVDDLTHEIPAYNIWEAAYRLNAVIDYWPTDTVFVSVVDPGVGTARKSVVARLKNGQTIVTPDNGTLTLVADRVGVSAVREIDERTHRLPGSPGFVYVSRARRLCLRRCVARERQARSSTMWDRCQSDIVRLDVRTRDRKQRPSRRRHSGVGSTVRQRLDEYSGGRPADARHSIRRSGEH